MFPEIRKRLVGEYLNQKKMKEQLDIRQAINKRWVKKIKLLPKYTEHHFGIYAGVTFTSMIQLKQINLN